MKLKNLLARWLDVGTINPERDEAKMPVLLLWVERLSIIVVAIVSGIAVAAYGYLLASGYTSLEPVRWLAAIVFFTLATAITDVGVKFFIQKGAFDFFAALNPATYKDSGFTWFQRVMQLVTWSAMVAIIAGLFYFDYISVESVRRPVANMVKQEKQLNQDSLREIILAQEKARVGATASAIQSAQMAIVQLQREVRAIEKRVEAKNGALNRLIAKGNGWAVGQLEAKKNNATASIRRQIERENENLSFLREQQAKELSYSRTIVAKSDSATLATNAAIAGRNMNLVEGTSTMFIWLGFFAKCIAGLIRILLVAMFMGGTIKDYNGDGRVDHTDVNAAAGLGFQPG